MAESITVTQAWDGVDLQLERGSGSNDASSATVHYIVSGTESEAEACTACYAAAPATYADIDKKSVAISERLTDTSWKVEVRYGSENKSNDSGNEDDEATVNFDCSASTKHMTQAISQTCVYAASGEKKDSAKSNITCYTRWQSSRMSSSAAEAAHLVSSIIWII